MSLLSLLMLSVINTPEYEPINSDELRYSTQNIYGRVLIGLYIKIKYGIILYM